MTDASTVAESSVRLQLEQLIEHADREAHERLVIVWQATREGLLEDEALARVMFGPWRSN
jgi:hypothetical protein